MHWTDLIIEVPVKDTDIACDIATTVCPQGFYVEDYSDLETEAPKIAHINLIDEDLLKRDKTHAKIHLYIGEETNVTETLADLFALLEEAGIDYHFETECVADEDWENNWKQYFHPTPIGEKLLILPTWERTPDTSRLILKIDPGAAFGTGTHQTTKLCLEAIEENIGKDDKVLDIGCGSGILSIASLLLGARRVTGIDIDPVAVRVARENGQVNRMKAPAYTVLTGDINMVCEKKEKLDLIAANIVADVIVSILPKIPKLLDDDGTFITSGIIDGSLSDVEKKIKSLNMQIVDRKNDDGWNCLVVKR